METLKSKTSFIGIGNIILDIAADVSKETLAEFGLEFGRTIFANDTNRDLFKVLEADANVKYISGGSITNTIRVLKWMLKDNSNQVKLLGATGDDEYGKKILSDLEAVGVEPLIETIAGDLTSRCGCGILKKERSLLPDIRASAKLSQSFVESQLKDSIASCKYFLIEGYFILSNYDLLKYIVGLCKENGVSIVFTLSAVFMVQSKYDEILQLCNDSDLIFCNEDEAQEFVGKRTSDMEEVSAAFHLKLEQKK